MLWIWNVSWLYELAGDMVSEVTFHAQLESLVFAASISYTLILTLPNPPKRIHKRSNFSFW